MNEMLLKNHLTLIRFSKAYIYIYIYKPVQIGEGPSELSLCLKLLT